jgi:hypothetical protein
MNLARSLFLAGWAYAYGSEAIAGALHDGTGLAVLGLTTLGLFAMLPLFSPARGSGPAPGAVPAFSGKVEDVKA